MGAEMTGDRNAWIIAAIKAYTEAACESSDIARATLVRECIYLPDGRLAPEYGGEIETDWVDDLGAI